MSTRAKEREFVYALLQKHRCSNAVALRRPYSQQACFKQATPIGWLSRDSTAATSVPQETAEYGPSVQRMGLGLISDTSTRQLACWLLASERLGSADRERGPMNTKEAVETTLTALLLTAVVLVVYRALQRPRR